VRRRDLHLLLARRHAVGSTHGAGDGAAVPVHLVQHDGVGAVLIDATGTTKWHVARDCGCGGFDAVRLRADGRLHVG